MTETPLLLGGRYELGDVLGHGGMAEVHLGRDLRLGRTVAIKVLRADLARDPGFQARFRREAQSAASLNHPAVVAVYDTGEDALNGHPAPFIVMEHVEGSTLRELLGSGHRLLPERALEITDGVLTALDYSHRNGIIHRDIKPGNVMLTPAGEVKVMDFGIARAVADSAATLTQSAAIIGTAQYLSPEQARGESVDARSDLYSTGCLLYELLTGRPPFVGDSPVSVAYQHVREEPRPPSALEPDIPPAVDAITLRALAKDPEQRYQRAAERRADRERAPTGRPVQAVLLARGAAPAAVPAAAATSVQPRQEEELVAPPPDRRRRRTGWLLLLPLLLLLGLGAFLLGRSVFDGPSAATRVAVPDVVGKSQEEARDVLGDAGLELAVESERPSDEQPGTVLTQVPAAQASAVGGDTVRVTVAAARGQGNVPMVVGLPVAQARDALEQAGLQVGPTEEEDSPRPEGEVLDADPAEGTSVDRGTSVSLLVASGSNTVPDVEGSAADRARAELEDAGFDVRVRTRRTDAADPNTVLAQSPSGGRTAKLGAAVTLTVAQPAPAPSPTPTETTPPPSPEPTPTPTPTRTSPSPTPTPTPTRTSPSPTPTPTPTTPTSTPTDTG